MVGCVVTLKPRHEVREELHADIYKYLINGGEITDEQKYREEREELKRLQKLDRRPLSKTFVKRCRYELIEMFCSRYGITSKEVCDHYKLSSKISMPKFINRLGLEVVRLKKDDDHFHRYFCRVPRIKRHG
jgi:hypothetical protein